MHGIPAPFAQIRLDASLLTIPPIRDIYSFRLLHIGDPDRWLYYWCSSKSIVILISSLNRVFGYFSPKLKSLRLIVVVADSPVTGSPSMPFCGAAGLSASRLTGLVTPAMVRFPNTSKPLSDFLTDVDLKIIRGYFETLKKSLPLRVLSR